ncbi:hypothetical protein [Streptomyces kebangsaanensis]|uniref:hypothetical protein n=1 Tax=Streptomyces kebangsaanensis TaxID=864058 RepID=UPI00093CFB4C|nr:hypothetical protein [Streptomyces kebangsaanensis]
MADVEKMIQQLSFLLSAGYRYATDTSWAGGDSRDPTVIGNRIASAIERTALPGSSYIRQLKSTHPLPQPYRYQEIYAVAQGLHDDLVAGWYESMVELVHADTYSDYLEMADELLGAGYKDPAAVITGTSLEVHVRALCVKHGVNTELSSGTPKKADVMNADLKKADVYDGLRQKQITAWMDLRNKAAHGDYQSYDGHQVRMFIDGVRDFMLKHPA